MTSEKDFSTGLRNATAELASAFGGQRLLHLAMDAVQTADTTELRRASAWYAPVSAPMLLTLLTCCYARGMYDSRDIVAAANYDPMVRYLCKGTRLRWEVLRSFRRKHRELLLHCLGWVLKQAWKLKLAEGKSSGRGHDWFENQFATFIAREAIARLEVAASLDTAAAD
jgi:transposase